MFHQLAPIILSLLCVVFKYVEVWITVVIATGLQMFQLFHTAARQLRSHCSSFLSLACSGAAPHMVLQLLSALGGHGAGSRTYSAIAPVVP